MTGQHALRSLAKYKGNGIHQIHHFRIFRLNHRSDVLFLKHPYIQAKSAFSYYADNILALIWWRDIPSSRSTVIAMRVMHVLKRD